MGMINLSEIYRENFELTFLERILANFQIDLYYASTLASIDEHFNVCPPQKKDVSMRMYSASVLLYDLEIREFDDGFNDKYKTEFDDGLYDKEISLTNTPFFELRDATQNRIACWLAGDLNKYKKDKYLFGFDYDRFVNIPIVFLQYVHDEKGGWLAIKSLDTHLVKPKESLMDKIKSSLPNLNGPTLEPNYSH